MAQTKQLLPGGEQGALVVCGAWMIGVRAVVVELREHAGHFALGLQQQPLRVAGQLARGQQLVGGEARQFGETGTQPRGQVLR